VSVRTRTALSHFCLAILAVVFLFAAVSKLTESRLVVGGVARGPEVLAVHLGLQGVIPTSMARPVAWGVVGFELTISALLAFGVRAGLACRLATGFFVAATAYLIVVRFRTGTVECNCFGGRAGGSLAMLGARNAVFITLSLVAVLLGETDGASRRPASLAQTEASGP